MVSRPVLSLWLCSLAFLLFAALNSVVFVDVPGDDDVNGGWSSQAEAWLSADSPLAGIAGGVCNIERVPLSSVAPGSFERLYSNRPVILVDDRGRNEALRRALTKRSLIAAYNDTEVVLSTANAQSYVKKRMQFGDYVAKMMQPWSPSQRGADSFYLFGDNEWWKAEWKRLQQLYEPVPLYRAAERQSLSLGLGGSGSGVPFHTHGPVFAELFYGRKRWWLYPPDGSGMPAFDPDSSSLAWLTSVYPQVAPPNTLFGMAPPLECTCSPGDILWLPGGWYHSTLNIGETVFLSAFV